MTRGAPDCPKSRDIVDPTGRGAPQAGDRVVPVSLSRCGGHPICNASPAHAIAGWNTHVNVPTRCAASGAPDRSDGYRLAKCQGKPNSANARKPVSTNHFCDFAAAGADPAFTSDSSRTLNCPSNLIGHDHPNKPANGEGPTGRFLQVDGSRARGRAANNQKGDVR